MSPLERRLCSIVEDGEPKMPPKWAVGLVVAYADDGDFYLPCQGRRSRKHAHSEPWWDVPLRPWRLTHLPYLALSVLTGWVMWVESC